MHVEVTNTVGNDFARNRMALLLREGGETDDLRIRIYVSLPRSVVQDELGLKLVDDINAAVDLIKGAVQEAELKAVTGI